MSMSTIINQDLSECRCNLAAALDAQSRALTQVMKEYHGEKINDLIHEEAQLCASAGDYMPVAEAIEYRGLGCGEPVDEKDEDGFYVVPF